MLRQPLPSQNPHRCGESRGQAPAAGRTLGRSSKRRSNIRVSATNCRSTPGRPRAPALFVGQLDIERFINIGDILDGLGLRLAEDEERGTGVLIHGDRDTRPGQADLNLFVLPKSGTDKTAKIGFWRLSVGSLGIPETFGPAGAAIPSNSLLPP